MQVSNPHTYSKVSKIHKRNIVTKQKKPVLVKGEEEFREVRYISEVLCWVSAKFTNSKINVVISTTLSESKAWFKIEFYPLNK